MRRATCHPQKKANHNHASAFLASGSLLEPGTDAGGWGSLPKELIITNGFRHPGY